VLNGVCCRLQMGKKTFHSLLDFFMSKTIDLAHSRLPRTEEAFRNVATLHMLLQVRTSLYTLSVRRKAIEIVLLLADVMLGHT
jgi:hypothetical protein